MCLVQYVHGYATIIFRLTRFWSRSSRDQDPWYTVRLGDGVGLIFSLSFLTRLENRQLPLNWTLGIWRNAVHAELLHPTMCTIFTPGLEFPFLCSCLGGLNNCVFLLFLVILYSLIRCSFIAVLWIRIDFQCGSETGSSILGQCRSGSISGYRFWSRKIVKI